MQVKARNSMQCKSLIALALRTHSRSTWRLSYS
jgi:hypothetical protein